MLKKIILTILAFFFVCTSTTSSYAAPSAINNLYPTDEEMGLNTNVELLYQEIPPENYKWDTNLRFAEWSGILPEFKNPADVTDNTVVSGLFKTSVQFVRFAVFMLNMGFSINILTQSIEQVEGKLEVLSDRFFQDVFPITSFILVVCMIVAWVRGRKGQVVKLLLVALITSTVLLGGAKHISTIAKMTAGVVDDISRSVIGVLNIDEEPSSSIGTDRIARTSNMIWQVTVDEPWTIGQFGSQIFPNITDQEEVELTRKGVVINSGENWKDLFLKYSPGSKERASLVEILADENITHDNELASLMMGEYALSTRIKVSALSFVASLCILALFFIVSGLMIVSGILLLAGMIALPFIAPLPFLGDIGMRWVKQYLSLMVGSALMKISSTIYISIIMLLLYIINLFDEWHYLVTMAITIVVVAVAVYLSPVIWRRLAPGILTITGIGERAVRGTMRQAKKLTPQESMESMYERYGKIKEAKREQRSLEAEMEQKRAAPIKKIDDELSTLQNVKHQDAAQYVASGLDQREKQLREQRFKAELANASLPNLQSQRQQYENRMATGESLTDQEQRELKMIQEAERNSLRSSLKPSDRSTFDELSYKHRNNFTELKSLQQQKAENPMEFVASGGEAKMSYLEQQQQQVELRERELLKANTVPENEANKDLRQYIRGQANESVLTNHAQNIAPQIDEGRQLFIESMNQDERQAEQQIYEAKLTNNEQLSAEEQNDFFYLHHNDWKETISSMDAKEHQQELQSYHFKETNYESQLRQLSHARENEPDDFLKMGGAVRQEEIQQNLYDVREQTQEVLRNSGNREAAEKHIKMAEQRDKMFNIAERSSTNPHLKLVSSNDSGIDWRIDNTSNSGTNKKSLTHADIIRRAREQREREKMRPHPIK